jgi:hypothetical protein
VKIVYEEKAIQNMEEESNWRTTWQVDQNQQDLNISKNKERNKESEVLGIMNFEFLWSFEYYEFWIFMKFWVLWILHFEFLWNVFL